MEDVDQVHRRAWSGDVVWLRRAHEHGVPSRTLIQRNGGWRRMRCHMDKRNPSTEVHPLFWAIRSPLPGSHAAVTFYLDDQKVPVTMRSFQNVLPLHAALRFAEWPKLKDLIDRHRGRWLTTLPSANDLPALPVSTPLAYAVWVGRWNAVRRMLQWRADINALAAVGEPMPITNFAPLSPLGIAVVRSQQLGLAAIRCMIHMGAELNAPVSASGSSPRWTALGLAATLGMPAAVKLLLQAGASPTVENGGSRYDVSNTTWIVARSVLYLGEPVTTLIAVVAAGGTWDPTQLDVEAAKRVIPATFRRLLAMIEGLWAIQRRGCWDPAAATVRAWKERFGELCWVSGAAIASLEASPGPTPFGLYELGRVLHIDSAGWLVRQAQYGAGAWRVPAARRLWAAFWHPRCKVLLPVKNRIAVVAASICTAATRGVLPQLPQEMVEAILSFVQTLKE